MRKNTIIIHGALVILIGITYVAVSQQVDDGNHIVPIATLDLGHHMNKSAAGHKKKCGSHADCEKFANSQCCKTVSGFSKCRKKCKHTPKLSSSFRTRRGRRKYIRIITVLSPDKGCNVGGKVYKEGQKMEATDACKKCVCSKGMILCTDMLCFSDKNVCNVGDKVYKEGQKIEAKDSCNKCVCSKGLIICTNRLCPPAKCSYKGELYGDGYHLVLRNGCKRCTCQQKIWNCTSHPCEDLEIRNLVMAVVPSILVAVLSSFYSIYLVWIS